MMFSEFTALAVALLAVSACGHPSADDGAWSHGAVQSAHNRARTLRFTHEGSVLEWAKRKLGYGSGTSSTEATNGVTFVSDEDEPSKAQYHDEVPDPDSDEDNSPALDPAVTSIIDLGKNDTTTHATAADSETKHDEAGEGEDDENATAAADENATAAADENATAAADENATAAADENATAAEDENTAAAADENTTVAEDENTTAAADENATAAADEKTTVAAAAAVDESHATDDHDDDDDGGDDVADGKIDPRSSSKK